MFKVLGDVCHQTVEIYRVLWSPSRTTIKPAPAEKRLIPHPPHSDCSAEQRLQCSEAVGGWAGVVQHEFNFMGLDLWPDFRFQFRWLNAHEITFELAARDNIRRFLQHV